MTLEDDTLETSGDGEKAPSVSETDISTEATAEPVDVNAIETVSDPEKPEKDPKNPFENDDEEIVDDPEQTEPSETQPLNAKVDGKAATAASVHTDNGEIEGDLEEGIISREDLDSPVHKKRAWDCRCVIIGILVLVIMVGGAAVAILAQKFKSPNYNFRFASYYGDHMVLQRAPQKAVVWGYGPIITDNTTIKIKLAKEGAENQDPAQELEFLTIVKNNEGRGIWKVLLGPISDPGPYTLTALLVDQEGHVLTIHDVLFGDVWLCAGEGNMQYSVGQLQNASEEIAAAEKYQNIRLFSASPAASDIAWYDLRGIQLHWSRPSRDTLVGRTIPASQLGSFFPAVCWLYGKQLQDRLKYPIGLVAATYNGSLLEEWTSQGVLDECGYTYNPVKSHRTSRVWNAMLHPLLDISVYGALWYQGESDAMEMSRNYNCTLVKMFGEWREKAFHRTLGATDPNFPIGTVQLAPNRPDDHLTYGFTDIRWRQTANYGFTPNPLLNKVFMAVAMDLPDVNGTYGSMYSTHKHEVVNRLVRGALAIAYQQKNATFRGPFPSRYSASGSTLTLYLTPNAHLEKRSNQGFEVCCSKDRKLFCPSSYIKAPYAPGREWKPAVITSVSSSSVSLSWASCGEGTHVVGIRYAWRETPCELRQCAVYDAFTTLPMPPYIKMGLIDDGATHALPEEQINLI